MFDNATIKAISLPALSERERQLRSTSGDESTDQSSTKKDTAQINAGALLVFDRALPPQSISDINNSLLLAQLAATAKHNRFSESAEWTKVFFEVLSGVGWGVNSTTSNGPAPLPLPVDWPELVTWNMANSAMALSDAGVKAAQALPQTNKAIKIWDQNASDGNNGLMLVGAAQFTSDNVTLSLTLTNSALQSQAQRFLDLNLDYLVKSSWTGLELNEEVYSKVRQAIIDKLGDRPALYVANVPIPSTSVDDNKLAATMSYPKNGHRVMPPSPNDEALVRQLMQSQTRPEPQIVFPPDTRTRVEDTTAYPWSAMGQLIMEFPNGERYTGTGTLIDGSHVLTAAHNLYGKDVGGWAKRVWYIPARNGDEEPYGVYDAERIFITEDYYTLSPPDPNSTPVYNYTLYTEDYGLVRLQKPVRTPILGMYAASDHELQNLSARITGYPGDKAPQNTMWTDSKGFQLDPTFLFYRINTFRGQSGASVVVDLELPVGKAVVGVHVAGDQRLKTNFGVRLTRHIINQVLGWMRM